MHSTATRILTLSLLQCCALSDQVLQTFLQPASPQADVLCHCKRLRSNPISKGSQSCPNLVHLPPMATAAKPSNCVHARPCGRLHRWKGDAGLFQLATNQRQTAAAKMPRRIPQKRISLNSADENPLAQCLASSKPQACFYYLQVRPARLFKACSWPFGKLSPQPILRHRQSIRPAHQPVTA